jgi:hypothetical protein
VIGRDAGFACDIADRQPPIVNIAKQIARAYNGMRASRVNIVESSNVNRVG